MKITELIEKLQALKEESGDLNVCYVGEQEEFFRIEFLFTIEPLEIPDGPTICGLIADGLAEQIKELKKPRLESVPGGLI